MGQARINNGFHTSDAEHKIECSIERTDTVHTNKQEHTKTNSNIFDICKLAI